MPVNQPASLARLRTEDFDLDRLYDVKDIVTDVEVAFIKGGSMAIFVLASPSRFFPIEARRARHPQIPIGSHVRSVQNCYTLVGLPPPSAALSRRDHEIPDRFRCAANHHVRTATAIAAPILPAGWVRPTKAVKATARASRSRIIHQPRALRRHTP